MKKMMVVFTLFLCGLCVFAGDIRDTWFDSVCSGAEQNLPNGCTLRKEKSLRIIFIDMPLPIHSSKGFDVAAGKQAVLKELRGTTDADFVKKADILIIYNFVTTDQKIFSIVISKKDL